MNEAILFHLGMGAGEFILLWTISVIFQGCLALAVTQGNKGLMKLRRCVYCNSFREGEEVVLNQSQYLMYSAQHRSPFALPVALLISC